MPKEIERWAGRSEVPPDPAMRPSFRLPPGTVTLIVFVLGVLGALVSDRIALERTIAVQNQQVASLSERLARNEAFVHDLEKGNNQTARLSMNEIGYTADRIDELEKSARDIAVTVYGLVASQRSMLELTRDVKRLEMLSHSGDTQGELQQVRRTMESQEQETEGRLQNLDNRVASIVTQLNRLQREHAAPDRKVH